MNTFTQWLMNGLRGAVKELNLSGLGRLLTYFKSGKNSEVTQALKSMSGKDTKLDNKELIDIAANALGTICGISCISTAISTVIDAVASVSYGSASLVGIGVVDILSTLISGVIGIAISIGIYFLITYVFRTFEHKKVRFDTLNTINILLLVFMAINIGSQILSIAGSGLLGIIGVIGFGITAIMSIISICISVYASLATLGVYSYLFDGMHSYIMKNKYDIEHGFHNDSVEENNQYFDNNGRDI